MLRPCARSLASLLLCVAAIPLSAQLRTPLDSTTMSAFRWRNIGPANTMGRVSDVVGIPSPSRTFFVAAAGGGIWKTTNAGVTFRPVFEHERVVSMGVLAIAPQRHDAGLGRHRRAELAQLDLARRRHLQVHRRRHDLEVDGPREDAAHRAHRRAPDQSEHRLGRRARRAVEQQSGARSLQDRPTAGRPGSSSSSSATRPASSTSRSIRPIRTCSSRRS